MNKDLITERMKPTDMKPRGCAVGLTGGIACGKTEVGRLFEREGAAVLDADDVAHEAIRKGRPAYQRIMECFGSGILGVDGEIDRPVLARRVFGDDRDRKALEAIVHPEVVEILRGWRDKVVAGGGVAVGIIPLLYEVGLEGMWDVVVCVKATPVVVAERLRLRGWTDEDAAARIGAQMPVEEKARRADYVIENNGSRDELAEKARDVWARISRKEKSYHG